HHAYADKLIACSYTKPDDRRLRDMAALSGARPEEILYVGDNTLDLDVVYRERGNPGAIFCFQEQGAADICSRALTVDARLRAAHGSLGADAVKSKIDQYGVSQDIVWLRNGFTDLVDLLDAGHMTFAAIDRKPSVCGNKLM